MRSVYKIDYQHKKIYRIYRELKKESLLKKYKILKKKMLRPLKISLQIFKKSSSIQSPILGRICHIHDGLFFQRIAIKLSMLSLKFGQFIFTKRMGLYIHKDNKIAKKKAKLLKQLAAKSLAKKKPKKRK